MTRSTLHEELLSRNPAGRTRALQTILPTDGKSRSFESQDAFPALLFAVSIRDPSPTVRSAALAFCEAPSVSIAFALRDANPDVRTSALKALSARAGTVKTSEDLLPSLLSLLALESEETIVLAALATLSELFLVTPSPISNSVTLGALTIDATSTQGFAAVFAPLEADAILRDTAEHDLASVRGATATVLHAILSRQLSTSRTLSSLDVAVVTEAFALLQELVQDASVPVRRVAAFTIAKLVDEDESHSLCEHVLLCEASAKCLLQLTGTMKVVGGLPESTDGRMVAKILSGYALDSFTAYAFVETSLRRKLYVARQCLVQRHNGAAETAAVVQEMLKGVVKRNRDFARVCDLVRPASDKLAVDETAA